MLILHLVQGNSLTLEIECVLFLSCNIVFASCFISLCFSLFLENSLTDGCIHSEGMTSLGLRYTLSALLQAHAHECKHTHKTETHTCTQLCPKLLRNEDGYTCAQGVFAEENSQWALHRDWWSCWVWNRCQDVSLTPLRHFREIPINGFGKCVPVELWVGFPTSVRLVPQR